MKCLEVLSKMAFLSLTSGKIIFKEEDFKDLDIDNVENIFEISGLITKIEGEILMKRHTNLLIFHFMNSWLLSISITAMIYPLILWSY